MERIILKVSGASLKDENNPSIINSLKLNDLVNHIKKLTTKYSVSIVVGGGNIWRGNFNKELNLNRNSADDMGMIATILNALLIKNALTNIGVPTKVFANVNNQWTEPFIYENINEWLNGNKNVAIFAGGTGNPFFSTDTAAALRAAQIGASKIYMGKNGVDGVFNKDPKKFKDALFYEHLNYQDVVNQKLGVMDLTALTMCEENNIELIVFNIDNYHNIDLIVDDKPFKHTLINNKK